VTGKFPPSTYKYHLDGPHLAPNCVLLWLGPLHCPNLTTATAFCAEHLQPTLTDCRRSKKSLQLDLHAGFISPLSWPPYICYRSNSESSIKLYQLPTKLVPQNPHHICRAPYTAYRTIFQAKLFVLLTDQTILSNEITSFSSIKII